MCVTPCKAISLIGHQGTNMFKCLNDLIATIKLQWRTVAGMTMVAYLCAVASYWADLHVWIWVALICGLYLLAGECKHRLDTIMTLTAWWCGNVTITLMLNSAADRPYMESGGMVEIFGCEAPVLTMDFMTMAAYDLGFLGMICWMTYKNVQRLTVWSLTVCTYLVANLWSHFNSSFALYAGTDPATVGAQYDYFMYAAFYVCLALLMVGNIAGRLLSNGHSDAGMDMDLRSIIGRRHTAKQGV